MFIKRMPNLSINNLFSWFKTELNSNDEARHVQLTCIESILVISKRINNDLQFFFRFNEPYDQRFELIFDKFQIEISKARALENEKNNSKVIRRITWATYLKFNIFRLYRHATRVWAKFIWTTMMMMMFWHRRFPPFIMLMASAVRNIKQTIKIQ